MKFEICHHVTLQQHLIYYYEGNRGTNSMGDTPDGTLRERNKNLSHTPTPLLKGKVQYPHLIGTQKIVTLDLGEE